jgi:3-hydroxyisobutyrate dehydrogenase
LLPDEPRSIAFIGLGIMGRPMAGHLMGGGNRLIVHTRSRVAADGLLSGGAAWADTPAAAAAVADVVFVCVPDTSDVQEVLLGYDGVIASARPGLIVVDHSTISPAATREMGAALADRGVTLLDAPVSGGDAGARNGSLSIMVGGPAKQFEQVRPLLERTGKTITHCGPSGAGQMTKLVNQVLVSVTNLAVCEALSLAAAGGLDLQRTIGAVAGGAAASWQLSNLGLRMAAGDFSPGFKVALQAKDLRLVREAAADVGVSLATIDHVAGLFARLERDGRGGDGTQALFEAVRASATIAPVVA